MDRDLMVFQLKELRASASGEAMCFIIDGEVVDKANLKRCHRLFNFCDYLLGNKDKITERDFIYVCRRIFGRESIQLYDRGIRDIYSRIPLSIKEISRRHISRTVRER